MQLKTIREFIDHSSLDMDHKLWVSENKEGIPFVVHCCLKPT